jgi:hypothetical protein
MFELINLFNKILSGQPIPDELQTQIDTITDKLAATVADEVIRRLSEEGEQ